MPRTRASVMGLLIAAAGCGSDQRHDPIPIEDDNDLGVVAMQIDRFEDRGDNVFELRGLDAADRDVALVRLRVGNIADLPELQPSAETSHGAELIVSSAGGEPQRTISSETQRFTIFPAEDRALGRFLALDIVSATLEREANIHYVRSPLDAPRADESGYEYWGFTSNCTASQLNVTPLASQCCYTWDNGPGWPPYTLFINAATNVQSQRMGPSFACTAQDGSPCSGANCYYGPNGSARAWMASAGTNPKVRTQLNNYPAFCYLAHDTSAAEFPNVTGSYPTGQGCCVNGNGPCGTSPRPACTACGGGGSAGLGAWDY